MGSGVRLRVGVAARAKVQLDLLNLLLESRIVLTLDVGARRGLTHRVKLNATFLLFFAVRGKLAISFVQRLLLAFHCHSSVCVSKFDLTLRHPVDHLMAALLVIFVISLQLTGYVWRALRVLALIILCIVLHLDLEHVLLSRWAVILLKLG